MGGRGQFVLREFYDPFLSYGLDILPKKFNFIDVGCSRGFFTLYLLAINNPDSKGICIDPFNYALDDLSEVLKLNKFENIKIIHGVVSDKVNDKTFVHNTVIPSEASIIKKESQIIITTDSKYVQNGITNWINNWKLKGWKTANKKPVKNKELWIELDALTSIHNITWEWVKGHTGHPGNEKADELANKGIDAL